MANYPSQGIGGAFQSSAILPKSNTFSPRRSPATFQTYERATPSNNNNSAVAAATSGFVSVRRTPDLERFQYLNNPGAGLGQNRSSVWSPPTSRPEQKCFPQSMPSLNPSASAYNRQSVLIAAPQPCRTNLFLNDCLDSSSRPRENSRPNSDNSKIAARNQQPQIGGNIGNRTMSASSAAAAAPADWSLTRASADETPLDLTCVNKRRREENSSTTLDVDCPLDLSVKKQKLDDRIQVIGIDRSIVANPQSLFSLTPFCDSEAASVANYNRNASSLPINPGHTSVIAACGAEKFAPRRNQIVPSHPRQLSATTRPVYNNPPYFPVPGNNDDVSFNRPVALIPQQQQQQQQQQKQLQNVMLSSSPSTSGYSPLNQTGFRKQNQATPAISLRDMPQASNPDIRQITRFHSPGANLVAENNPQCGIKSNPSKEIPIPTKYSEILNLDNSPNLDRSQPIIVSDNNLQSGKVNAELENILSKSYHTSGSLLDGLRQNQIALKTPTINSSVVDINESEYIHVNQSDTEYQGDRNISEQLMKVIPLDKVNANIKVNETSSTDSDVTQVLSIDKPAVSVHGHNAWAFSQIDGAERLGQLPDKVLQRCDSIVDDNLVHTGTICAKTRRVSATARVASSFEYSETISGSLAQLQSGPQTDPNALDSQNRSNQEEHAVIVIDDTALSTDLSAGKLPDGNCLRNFSTASGAAVPSVLQQGDLVSRNRVFDRGSMNTKKIPVANVQPFMKDNRQDFELAATNLTIVVDDPQSVSQEPLVATLAPIQQDGSTSSDVTTGTGINNSANGNKESLGWASAHSCTPHHMEFVKFINMSMGGTTTTTKSAGCEDDRMKPFRTPETEENSFPDGRRKLIPEASVAEQGTSGTCLNKTGKKNRRNLSTDPSKLCSPNKEAEKSVKKMNFIADAAIVSLNESGSKKTPIEYIDEEAFTSTATNSSILLVNPPLFLQSESTFSSISCDIKSATTATISTEKSVLTIGAPVVKVKRAYVRSGQNSAPGLKKKKVPTATLR